jgi:signal transduction histidine kinase
VNFLRAPFNRRAWSEVQYALVGLPLGLLGLPYAVVTVGVGGALSLTVLGLPLMAAGIVTARRIGALWRVLARKLLGLRVEAPPPFRPDTAGPIRLVRSALRDTTGWRALAYLVLKAPLAVVTGYATIAVWGYGLGNLTYPLWWWALPWETDSHGRRRHGIGLFGDVYIDSWPKALAAAAFGAVLCLLAPWVVHGLLGLDRWLMPRLLGPTRVDTRVRDLEQTRAHAVDDAAAQLRRIERDLHDGAQARLVALAMTLGMAADELDTADPDEDPEVVRERARRLVARAHENAKETLTELRDLARGIHPPALDKGLDTALTTLAARSPVPVQVTVDVPARPSGAIETIAYFCAAELLTNVAKHSGARHATLSITLRDGYLRVEVTDDGAGGAQLGQGTGNLSGGLAGLADRVATVDGTLTLHSPPGGPTTATVHLPVA